jgi:hypothetical protein
MPGPATHTVSRVNRTEDCMSINQSYRFKTAILGAPLEAFSFCIDVVATGLARWRRRRAPWCLTRRSRIRMGLYQLGNLADLWNLRAKGNLSYRRPAP